MEDFTVRSGNGYNWEEGKSQNAVWAEEEGLFPASKLASIYGVETQAISHLLPWEEWHHTSHAFNKTYYYSRDKVEERLDEIKALSKEIRRQRKEQGKHTYTFSNCIVEWTETVKDGRRFRDVHRSYKVPTVTGKGSTITVHDGTGKPYTKRSCTVTVNGSRHLDEVAQFILNDIESRKKRPEFFRLREGEKDNTPPFFDLMQISPRAVSQLAKRNKRIKQAYADLIERDKLIRKQEKEIEKFRGYMERQIKAEFLAMLRSLFGNKALLRYEKSRHSPFTEIEVKLTRNIFSRQKGFFVFMFENHDVTSVGFFTFKMKKVLEKYHDGELKEPIRLNNDNILTHLKK